MLARLVTHDSTTIATGPKHLLDPLQSALPNAHVETLYQLTITHMIRGQLVLRKAVFKSYSLGCIIDQMERLGAASPNAILGFSPVE
jgi:hypothetical protein